MGRMMQLTALERFQAKFTKGEDPDKDCWMWVAGVQGDNYGYFRAGRRMVVAHRFAYETFIGPIPDGLTIDHLCRNHRCVNPTHLEPVSMRENVLRGIAPTAKNAVKTSCIRGHPFDSENTHIRMRDGRPHRVCRACDRERTIK